MRLNMFAFYDTKAGCYMTPFFFPHVGQALRAAADLAQDTNTIIGRHPGDFALFQLGAWDDQTGSFEPVNPINLGLAVGFLPPPAPQLSLGKE